MRWVEEVGERGEAARDAGAGGGLGDAAGSGRRRRRRARRRSAAGRRRAPAPTATRAPAARSRRTSSSVGALLDLGDQRVVGRRAARGRACAARAARRGRGGSRGRAGAGDAEQPAGGLRVGRPAKAPPAGHGLRERLRPEVERDLGVGRAAHQEHEQCVAVPGVEGINVHHAHSCIRRAGCDTGGHHSVRVWLPNPATGATALLSAARSGASCGCAPDRPHRR